MALAIFNVAISGAARLDRLDLLDSTVCTILSASERAMFLRCVTESVQCCMPVVRTSVVVSAIERVQVVMRGVVSKIGIVEVVTHISSSVSPKARVRRSDRAGCM